MLNYIATVSTNQKFISTSKFNRIFGTSEASFISYNFNQSSPANSVGKLFPHVETRLLNQDDDAVGLLAVRSEMVFSGYVGQSNQEGHGLKQATSLILKSTFVLVGRESDRIIVGD